MLDGVDLQFVAQPFAGGRNLADFIETVASDPDLDNLDIVVAWAKKSGLNRLRGHLETIRNEAGHTRLIVGIDEGGATRQGLALARELFDSVLVLHDREGRTFHPKVYVGWGKSAARILVGSHNATAGGIYFNYEAGLECHLKLPDDAPLLNAFHRYIDRLRTDTSVCKELTDALFAELVSNPRYRVGDEDTRHARSTEAPEELDAAVDVETDPDPLGARPSIFGRSTEPKRPDPGGSRSAGAVGKKAGTAKKVASGVTSSTAGGVAASAVAVDMRWFKRLASSDAQHPPKAGSNVTGVLRLVQAGHPIDQTNYFRHNFFASLPWAGTPKPRGVLEQTVVPFSVVLNGVNLGVHNLRVDNAAYREAGQRNHTSVLHWDDLGPTLAAVDYTGHFVVLERLTDGSYRLEVTPTDPGPAAFLS
jgi:hypothetical protein